MSKKSNHISATLKAWSESLAIDPSTIKRKLAKREIKFQPGMQLTAMQIFHALTTESEKDQAITLKTLEETRAKKRQNAIAEGQLHDKATIEKLIFQGILVPLKQELEYLPDKVANLVNPEDPVSAHRVLTKAIEEIKQQIRNAKIKGME
jgi:hypothetical protein